MSANMAEETKRYQKVLARLTQREESQAIKSVLAHLADIDGNSSRIWKPCAP